MPNSSLLGLALAIILYLFFFTDIQFVSIDHRLDAIVSQIDLFNEEFNVPTKPTESDEPFKAETVQVDTPRTITDLNKDHLIRGPPLKHQKSPKHRGFYLTYNKVILPYDGS